MTLNVKVYVTKFNSLEGTSPKELSEKWKFVF